MTRRLTVAVFLALLTVVFATRTSVKAQAPSGPVEAMVADEKGKPIEDAVVSMTPLGTMPAAPPPSTALMDQHDKEFVPYVLPVYVGTRVTFPNRDNIRHHVYSFSSAKKFELPLYIGTPAAPVVFDKPGVVALGCNIHDQMSAFIIVTDSAWTARTNAEGMVVFGDAPSASGRLTVWHPYLRAPGGRLQQNVAPGQRNAGFQLRLRAPPAMPMTDY